MVKVVSLFDGISCGYMAMLSAGVDVTEYIAYEIDKYAIKASSHNFPSIIHKGDVFQADFTEHKGADFVIGGSPCTYWSIAQSSEKREKAAEGNGWTFFKEYVRAIQEIRPRYFIYENNKSMSNEIKLAISEMLGVQPVLINSALVSAQFRQRYYWVGRRVGEGYEQVTIPQPKDRGILLKDVLDGVAMAQKSHAIIGSIGRTTEREYFEKNQGELSAIPLCVNPKDDSGIQPSVQDRIYSPGGKSPACAAFIPSTIQPVGTTKDGKKAITLKAQYSKNGVPNFFNPPGKLRGATGVCERVGNLSENGAQSSRVYSAEGKSTTLNAGGGGGGAKTGLYALPVNSNEGGDIYQVEGGFITTKKGHRYPVKLEDGFYRIRKLSIDECKRLQTVPNWFDLSVISNTQAYKCLGNGWTVEVIAHLIATVVNDAPSRASLDYYL